MTRSIWVVVLVLGLVLSACVWERFPDVPGNLAINFTVAVDVGDEGLVASMVCRDIAEAGDLNLAEPASFGALAGFVEAVPRNGEAFRTAFGGDSEYTIAEEVDGLDVDEAWIEIEFRGQDLTETWRLFMVRENGTWKVCGAELRS